MATEVATLQFKADTTQLKSANDELAKTAQAGVRAEDAARKMGTQLKKAANDSVNPIQKVTGSVDALGSALTALGILVAIRQLVDYTNQWTDLNSRLVNATGSAEAANQAMLAISQTARTTYSSLQQTAEAFLLNSMAMNELGYTTRQQVEFADALNNALVISGTKGERAASVMNALSKAIALGKLSGENFNTVIQSGGRVVQALADGLGVTTAELRKMASDGLLTTELVVQSLSGEMRALQVEAEDMPATIGDALTQFSNLALEATGRLNEAVGLSGAIANFMIGAVDNFRRIHMPNEAQQLEKLQMRAIDLNIKIAQSSTLVRAIHENNWRHELSIINAEIEAINGLAAARAEADAEGAAEGIRVREELEARRIADHNAELARIQAEKDARAAEQRQAQINTSAQSIAESLMSDEEQIKMSYERQRGIILESTLFTQQQKREIIRQTYDQEIADLDRLYDEKLKKEEDYQEDQLILFLNARKRETAARDRADAARIEAQAEQTTQLLAFEDVLLKGKNSALGEAYRIGVNYADKDKRETAGKIIMKSYEAAMNAYAALSAVPFIGPALGAAAAATIIAAGASYSAKSLSGRALGGQVRGGESYVVGERGPEVLTMGSAGGKIIPNSAISNLPASGIINNTANVTFSITANDTRGFDELLLKRRGMIASLVQSSLNNLGRSI
jgi:tape measure domain-containing protein